MLTRGGLSTIGMLVLGAATVALRLTGVCDWPWWLILAPLWVPMMVTALGAAAVFTVVGLIVAHTREQ